MEKKIWIAISIVLLLSNVGLATALILQTLTIPATVKLEPQTYIELQHLNGTKIETLNFGTLNQQQTVTFDCRIVDISTETIQISWNHTLSNPNLTLELYYYFGGGLETMEPKQSDRSAFGNRKHAGTTIQTNSKRERSNGNLQLHSEFLRNQINFSFFLYF